MSDQNTQKPFFSFINKIFEPIDNTIGPNKLEHKPACDDDKEMFMECVMASQCYKQYEDFRYCAKAGADKQCKALRGQVFWNKAFSQDDPRGA